MVQPAWTVTTEFDRMSGFDHASIFPLEGAHERLNAENATSIASLPVRQGSAQPVTLNRRSTLGSLAISARTATPPRPGRQHSCAIILSH